MFSACSAVLAGFHLILRRSCPSAGKFSEITSFNYSLPAAAASDITQTVLRLYSLKSTDALLHCSDFAKFMADPWLSSHSSQLLQSLRPLKYSACRLLHVCTHQWAGAE